MSDASKLRKYFDAGRPVVERWLAVSEEFAEMRDKARVDEVDWAQVKALLKATLQDEQDGGTRVEKLVAKADSASEYAALLGLAGEISEKNISRASSSGGVEGHATGAPKARLCGHATAREGYASAPSPSTQAGIKPGPLDPASAAEPPASVAASPFAGARVEESACINPMVMDDIPEFLRRTA